MNVLAPFRRNYEEPTLARVAQTVCDENNHCVDYFEITARQTTARLANSGPPTLVFSYDGGVPGA